MYVALHSRTRRRRAASGHGAGLRGGGSVGANVANNARGTSLASEALFETQRCSTGAVIFA